MCAWSVRVALIFKLGILRWCASGFTTVWALYDPYIIFAELGEGVVKRSALVSLHGILNRPADMCFGHVFFENYLF